MADFLSFLDSLAGVDSRNAAGHLRHRNGDQDHPSDVLVVGFDDDDLPRSGAAQEGLLGLVLAHVGPLGVGLQHEEEAWDGVNVLHDAVHGSVPAVVAPVVQEDLEDRPADELLRYFFVLPFANVEHVKERVIAVLEPELVLGLDGLDWLKGSREWITLAGHHDDVVVLVDGEALHLDFPEEEVGPAFEPVVGLFEVQLEVIWVPFRRFGTAGFPFLDPLVDVLQGPFRIQHLGIVIENLPEMVVDLGRVEHSLKIMHKFEVDFVVDKLVVVGARRGEDSLLKRV